MREQAGRTMTVEQIIEEHKNAIIEALGLGEESPLTETIEEATYMFLSHLEDYD